MRACRADVAEELLRAGANPNIMDFSQHANSHTRMTPAHDVARQGYLDTLRCLLRYGADVTFTDAAGNFVQHCAKKPVTTMLTYPWKCTVLHCNHLGNTWKPLVLISRCFPGGYNVKLYISRGRLAWWLLAFLCCAVNHLQSNLSQKTAQRIRCVVCFIMVHSQMLQVILCGETFTVKLVSKDCSSGKNNVVLSCIVCSR